MYDNTVGSRSNYDIAYIAGFLDGDGSVMLQVKKRSDTRRGTRFMTTICLYQNTRHEKPLLWMRKVLGVGSISRRKDGMSELRIQGFSRVREILTTLLPYVRFKRRQVSTVIRACEILIETPHARLTDGQVYKLVDLVLVVQGENYASTRKRTRSELLLQLGLTP